ncbi:MAG TPA: SRPBCC domain-containing protein [Thermoplasmata archaeon]|nr:SRPBCC domain-containing protein [Thermoplasmata archaeon]
MPEATIRFATKADTQTLVRLLSDPTFVAAGIPQVISVERTGETTALWTVEVKLGPISRKSLYRGELLGASDSEVRFRAEGPEATIDGSVKFTSAAVGGTDVEFTLTMKGLGPLHAVVDAYLTKRVRSDAEKFAKSLEERVGNVPSAASPGASV